MNSHPGQKDSATVILSPALCQLNSAGWSWPGMWDAEVGRAAAVVVGFEAASVIPT